MKEKVIYFDFDALIWRYDSDALQSHLSDAGVDAYLHRIQATLPPDGIELLQVLACLPVAGCSADLLAEYLKIPRARVEGMVSRAQSIGALILVGTHIRFSHDRQRVCIAYNQADNSPPPTTRSHPTSSDPFISLLPSSYASPHTSKTTYSRRPITRSLLAQMAHLRLTSRLQHSFFSAPQRARP